MAFWNDVEICVAAKSSLDDPDRLVSPSTECVFDRCILFVSVLLGLYPYDMVQANYLDLAQCAFIGCALEYPCAYHDIILHVDI